VNYEKFLCFAWSFRSALGAIGFGKLWSHAIWKQTSLRFIYRGQPMPMLELEIMSLVFITVRFGISSSTRSLVRSIQLSVTVLFDSEEATAS